MSPVQKLHLESDVRSPARGLLTAVGEGREQGRHCIVTIALIGHSRASGAGGGWMAHVGEVTSELRLETGTAGEAGEESEARASQEGRAAWVANGRLSEGWGI